jgi:hypothetical protein
MKIIEVRVFVPIPDGKYCVDYGVNPEVVMCGSLRSKTESIGLSDGLVSPGSVTHYRCSVFDESLSNVYPHNGFYGLTVEKCKECSNS